MGLEIEPVIIGKYMQHQENNGHEGITVKGKGLVFDKDNPTLAAGVDGEVSDPTNKYHPIGNLEAKYKLLGTFSIRFFMGNGKPETAKYHVTTVLPSRLRFAVHVLTAEEASSGK